VERPRKAALKRHLVGLIRFGEAPEWFWDYKAVVAMYRDEHPEWTEDEIAAKAALVVDGQRELARDWYNAQRRFHQHASLIGHNTDEPHDPYRDLE